MKRKANPVDVAIESAYYRLAQGKQINIMDIPKVFYDCRVAVQNGQTVETAVATAVSLYCRKEPSINDVQVAPDGTLYIREEIKP